VNDIIYILPFYLIKGMTAELTIKDFLLHYLNNAYINRSKIIQNLTGHIERLHGDYIISTIERSRYMKSINDIIKLLNIAYNKRIKLIRDDDINNSTEQSETNECNSDESSDESLIKIDNLDQKLSTVIKFPLQVNNNNTSININLLSTITKLASTIYRDELKHITPNDFDSFDKKLHEIVCNVGARNINDVLLAFDKSLGTEIVDKNSLIYLLQKLFVPLCVVNTSVKNNLKIKITKPDEIPEKFESLLENFYKIEINTLEIFGFFECDCVNSNIRTSQICNQYLYDKKKSLVTLINNPENSEYAESGGQKVMKMIEKLKNIPLTFKQSYIKNMIIGDILSRDGLSFINNILNDYTIYQKYSTMNNFKSLFGEFVNSNLVTKFKIIKFLLLSSSISDAGLLFGLTKEAKSGSSIIADIIHKNLNLPLQLKLHKTSTYIKAEADKLNNLDSDDVDLKKQVISNKNMPQKVKKLALEKINEMKSGNSEYYKQLLYVKTLVDFPWIGENDGDIFALHKNDRQKWKEIMKSTNEKLHGKVYGHNDCKDTIIELLGKWFSNPKSLGKAVGLWGPPGVGKTLIAKELGDALGIPCTKINLGGMEDGAVLSGHSITYSGAVPGLIVKRMVDAGKPRCIMFFDELDKACYHHGRNEIYDILIHVIDSTTNAEFNDKFFQDVSFPINKVLFMFSFNDKSKIDPILLDRMEIIKVDAYTMEDKVNIVNKFLLKELKDDIGLNDLNIEISNENIMYLIDSFTQEPGVRSIRRKIEKILLKLNKDKIFDSGPFEKKDTVDSKKICITRDLIDKYLVKPSILVKKIGDVPEVGVVNGLFATTMGDGGIIPILVYRNQMGDGNKFSLKLTGKQGKVMKESVEIAWTLASNLVARQYLTNFFNNSKSGLHIHTPDGATDKDGPSAGSAFLLAFFSIILGKRVKNNIGITGELERSGCITAIGGLEYKLPGAKKAGIKLVFVPKENEKDIIKLKEHNKSLFDDNFKYILVNNITEVLNMALIELHGPYEQDNFVYEKLFNCTKYLKIEQINVVKVARRANNKKVPLVLSSVEDTKSDSSSCQNESSSYSSDRSK
jgi:endopeptidase La